MAREGSAPHGHRDRPLMASEDPSSEVLDLLRALREELAENLTAAGEASRVGRDAFEALHEELQQYKSDFQYQQEKPLLLDLLLFYDSLEWFQKNLKGEECSPEVVSDSLEYLLDEFLEILYRRGVVPVGQRDRFDRRTHKAIKAVPTPDPAAHEKVEEVLKRGFKRGDKVLRPEEVVILRHEEDPPSS